MKLCTYCGLEKLSEDFTKDKSVKSGLANICKSCSNARNSKRRLENLASYKKAEAKYREKNRDKLNERIKNWKLNNPKLISLSCEECEKKYEITIDHWNATKKKNPESKSFCSLRCRSLFLGLSFLANCAVCGQEIIREKNNAHHNRFFCQRKCQGKYSASNKMNGIKRSKLEVLVSKFIEKTFPDLHFVENDRRAIGSELDFFIPSLNLAIEISGIFHYEPIFGDSKLEKIKQNDFNKSMACKENKIELLVIDSSDLKHTSEKSAKPYLEIIDSEIRSRLNKTN
jgi:endogenous inhibitor of DNA gyrase (YacG/DUF329 family)